MDIVTAGLDFGTHQTKICIKTYPNEDYNHPVFEFFKFKDRNGDSSYFLPSEVQINQDDTLSYGFINRDFAKTGQDSAADSNGRSNHVDLDISKEAARLYTQYATSANSYEDIPILVKMLRNLKEKQQQEPVREIGNENFYKYFKQATFSEREWHQPIDCELISIWYLSYVIFLLEEQYGMNFNINMGVPVGEQSYEEKKEYATSVLLSAYYLVEEVYENDLNRFLNEKVQNLQEKTKFIFCTQEKKEEYNINIYPEAYAGLTTLTHMGKLSNGMSLIADIGGGTTDISFFTITDNKPVIYRYWSIPKGLNYIAEASGYEYKRNHISEIAQEEVIQKFINEESDIVNELVDDLSRQLKKETDIPKSNLYRALTNRIIVYNGGGSTESILVRPIHYFSDIKLMDAKMWKETNLKNKHEVEGLCQLLTTAYGLSIGRSDNEVSVCKFTNLFYGLGSKKEETIGNDINDKDS